MNKRSLIVLSVVLVAVAFITKSFAPSGLERSLVEYLRVTDGYNAEMKSVAKRMEQEMSGLQAKIQSGNFPVEEIKTRILSFAREMNDIRGKLENLSPSLEAAEYQELSLQKYQTAINVLAETPPIIDLAHKMMEATNLVKEDPSQSEKVMGEMQKMGNDIQAIQAKVADLAKRGHELEESVKKERKRLIVEYKLEFPEPAEDTLAE